MLPDSRLPVILGMALAACALGGCVSQIDIEMCDAMAKDGAAGVARARELIAQGADVNRRFQMDKVTCLMAVSASGPTEGVELLLESGADPDVEDARGGTALRYAAGRGQAEAVELLLAAGADVNHRARDGSTALSFAVSRGQQEVAALLRAAGAVDGDP